MTFSCRITLTAARLRELVDYDQTTGAFSRRVLLHGHGSGKVGRVNNGYLEISIDGKQYLAHRLAWLYVTGEWPEYTVDHINGAKTDNRFANLRDVPHRVNCQNITPARAARLDGLPLGVSKRGKRYSAHIMTHRKTKFLGTFDTPEEAHQSYIAAKRELHEGNTL